MEVEIKTLPPVDNTIDDNNTSPFSTGSSIPPAAFSTPENITLNKESSVFEVEYEGERLGL